MMALEQSLAALQRRHDALRTMFRPNEKLDAVAVVSQPHAVKFRLVTIDLSGISAACRDDMAHRIAHSDNARPFNLSSGPLFRARIIRLGPKNHLVLFTLHHLVCDGWSIDILVADLSRRDCHIAIGASAKRRRSGIVRPLRLRSATCPSPQRGACGAFGLK